MILALLTVLLEGLIDVPHSNWRAVDVRVKQPGTLIKCSFDAPESRSRIQVYLVSLRDAERFSYGRSMSPLATTSFEEHGVLTYVTREAGAYVLLLDNRIEGRRPTRVALKIELLAPAGEPWTLPAERRMTVVLASVLFVLAVVAYSARKLMK